MYLSEADFFSILKNDLNRVPYGSVPSAAGGPTGQQLGILSNSQTNWILAGPGTGKTETLVLRTLRLLLVDGVRPESIVLTTFTDRAARELFERLSEYLNQFLRSPSFPKTNPPDISRVWLGTLHGLAMRIMGEFQRTPPSLISEEEAMMLFMRSVDFWEGKNPLNNTLYTDLTGKAMKKEFPPKPINWAKNFRAAVNRVIEDDLDIDALKTNKPLSGSPLWSVKNNAPRLVEMMEKYHQALKGRFDFTLLQSGFLNFLSTKEAGAFLDGVSGNAARPGLSHIIVDEYQDANPIQERIYFTLATQSGATLTVVGDDDQSLYRFRGATPDALVQFDKQCTIYSQPSPAKIELLENRRSHPDIVKSLNEYISKCIPRAGFGVARSPKSPLLAKSSITGIHLSISTIVEPDEESLATKVASLVHDLYNGGEITHLGQVAILAQSTKQTGIAKFSKWEDAFSKLAMPLNNPGAKNLHTTIIVKQLIGCISLLLDDIMVPSKQLDVKAHRNAATVLLKSDKKFNKWFVDQRKNFILPINSKSWDKDLSLLGLANKVLGQDVFSTRINAHPFDAWIIGWLLRQFAAFDQVFGGYTSKRGKIPHIDGSYWTSSVWKTQGFKGKRRGVDPGYIQRLYTNLAALVKSGGHDTPTDDLVNLPSDQINALTVHQSKGLSFPIVFVDWRGVGMPWVGSSHLQETQFQPFSPRNHALTLPSPVERAAHDSIRKFFVALSRAKYAVVLCLTEKDKLAIATDSIAEIPSDWFNSLQGL